MNPLDSIRSRLGIQPLREGETAGPVVSGTEAMFEARRAQHLADMERLHKAGDDADGLEGVRQLFRRAGRG